MRSAFFELVKLDRKNEKLWAALALTGLKESSKSDLILVMDR